MSGFYYEIYPPAHIGRSPERPVHSVADQNRVEHNADIRSKIDLVITQRQYMRMGLWFPVRLEPHPLENGSGDIISIST